MMKLITSFFKSSKTLTNIMAVAGTALLFSACKTNDTPAPGIAAVNVTYAIPDGESVNFYLNNAKINSSPFTFGTKVDYFQVYEGVQNAKVYRTNDNSIFLNENLNLVGGQYYSLFIVNRKADAEFLLINDNVLPPPATGKAKVRFVNLAPDATALDLVIVDEETKFENKAFKAYTEFVEIPEKTTATLKLVNRADGNAEVATLNNVEIKAGSIYTIWAKGFLTTTETPQRIEIKVSKN